MQIAEAAQFGDDVFGNPVGKKFLLLVIAHIVKGKNGDCRLLRRCARCGFEISGRVTVRFCVPSGLCIPQVDVLRLIYILQLYLAAVFKLGVNFPAHLIMDKAGQAYPAWFGAGLQAGSDIHTVAMDIFTFNDDIADIDADAKLDLTDLKVAFAFNMKVQLTLMFD